MLFASRCFGVSAWRLTGAETSKWCSRTSRHHSSTVGRTLCCAPIRASRKDVGLIRASPSKFPFKDEFQLVHGETYDSAQVIDGLGPLLTSKRLESINKVVNGRSFSVLPLVEGLHDMGNLGAVCRSADALGFGAVHCINAESQRYRARKQRNSAGAEKWMDVRMWDSAAACISNAKAAGYRVVATHFDSAAVSIRDVDWTQPTAVILGNEREGTAFLGDRAACVILLRYVVSQMQSFFTVKVDKLTAESSYTDQDWSTGRNNATDVAKIGLYIPAPAATTTSCVLWYDAGVSAEAIRMADSTAFIPMSGFVSSFNVSVAAALVFYEACRARLEHLGYHCDLTDHDKKVLTAVMLLRHQGRTTENVQKLLERSQAESLSADSKLHRNQGRFS